METLNFKKHHWRKTSQWFSLLPLHAQLVMEDEEINDVFEKYCFPYMDLEAARYETAKPKFWCGLRARMHDCKCALLRVVTYECIAAILTRVLCSGKSHIPEISTTLFLSSPASTPSIHPATRTATCHAPPMNTTSPSCWRSTTGQTKQPVGEVATLMLTGPA